MKPHIPGPWRQGRPGTVVCDHVIGLPGHDDPENVAYYGGHLICESVAAAADAQLIAAAPTLLQALRAAFDYVDGTACPIDDPEEYRWQLRAQLLKAIDQAQGRP